MQGLKPVEGEGTLPRTGLGSLSNFPSPGSRKEWRKEISGERGALYPLK